MTSSSSHGPDFYFQFVLVIIGIVGVATNAVIIYAMIATNQRKKQLLIEQNIFDLCSSLALIVVFTVKLCSIHLSGALGYWLCIILISENLLWMVVNGAQINLMSITIERYLKVVYHQGKWIKVSAAVLAWIRGIVHNMALVYWTSDMANGVCYWYAFWTGSTAALGHGILHSLFYFAHPGRHSSSGKSHC